MPFIAHAAVQLEQDATAYEKNRWYQIKTVEDIEYRWRLDNSLIYEVVAGVFTDKYEALKYAKQMYVALLYSVLKGKLSLVDAGCKSYEQRLYHPEHGDDFDEYDEKEAFFFWNRKYLGGRIGPGVYEVEETIDDFDTFKFLSVKIRILSPNTRLDSKNVDEYIFTYCREAQKLLSAVVLADQASDYGMKMNIYCGLLEHLAISGYKEMHVISEIDKLINHVKCSDLTEQEKNQMKNYLNNGKSISSRQKCRTLLDRYAKKEYATFTAKQIFEEAYEIRSKFSHGEEISEINTEASHYIKFVILDVIRGYFVEKEAANV